MKKVLEFFRFFLVSFELMIILLGICAQMLFHNQVQDIAWYVKFQDDLFKFIIAIPSALCVWSFVSGRKLLFPDKDKASILQSWPEYWRLKTGFHAALTWNIIFVAVSVVAWTGDWKHPSASLLIWLVVALAGSGLSTLSLYNAQNYVEEETSQFKGQR